MKKVLLSLLLISAFSFCSYKKRLPDNEIIELPIELVAGYGPFSAKFASIGWNEHKEMSGAYVTMKGIPETWSDPVVKLIQFDKDQFFYQNLKEGKLNKDYVEDLNEQGLIQLVDQTFSESTIKCFTHILMSRKRDSSGNAVYKLDTDNDYDFSDEETQVAPPLDWANLDSLMNQYQATLVGEFFIKGERKQIELPILITSTPSQDIHFLRSFPIHARAEVLGQSLNISCRFSSPDFKRVSAICLQESYGDNEEIFKKNEFINISGQFFQNLGVDFNHQVLRLKKATTDTILESTQVGFHSPKFEGQDILTGTPLKVDDYRGKYLFLKFWGTWCSPCVQEIPLLKSTYETLDKGRVSFLGIASYERDPEKLKAFLEARGIKWEQVLSTDNNDIVQKYGIKSFPKSFLIDPSGVIVAKDLRSENLLDTLRHLMSQSGRP